MMNKIEVPISEILEAKETFFTKNADIARDYSNKPFQYVVALTDLVENIYKYAYESGYRAKELENIVNKVNSN